MNKISDEQLQDYLDGNLSTSEKALVEKALQESL